jgi:hypothetical protein
MFKFAGSSDRVLGFATARAEVMFKRVCAAKCPATTWDQIKTASDSGRSTDLRILAATVDGDLALDGGSVVAIYVHFPCGASEASAGVIYCFLLPVRRCKRLLNPRSLKRNPRAFESLTGSNLDDFHALSVANDVHSGSKSGS